MNKRKAVEKHSFARAAIAALAAVSLLFSTVPVEALAEGLNGGGFCF